MKYFTKELEEFNKIERKHDDMVDALRYALQGLTIKLTLWQKIVKWFRTKIKLLKQLIKEGK